jgi:F-type H+-transporting ATPase subunit gamma
VASLRELRRKVKSIKSTQQITKAMKLVAAARLNKAQERIVSARPFANKMETLLQELAYLIGGLQEQHGVHPFFKKRQSNRVDLVLVTADRGLCGGFNANLIRKTLHVLKDNESKDIHLWIVGRKGRDFFRRFNRKIEKEYLGVFQNLSFKQAEVIGDDLIQAYLASGTGEVVFIYNEFKSRIQQKLTMKTILPITAFEAAKPEQDFLYEPAKEKILTALLPRYVKAQIYRILLESQAAELAARMSAMESATNNARDLIYSLTLTMNKVRQAAITKEISEIVGGAEALQN